MMTCREFAEFIAEYDARELTSDNRASFERHLQLCSNCRRYVEQYRATIRMGRAVFEDLDAPAPDAVPEDLINAILEARKR